MRGVSGREWVVLSERLSPPPELVEKYGPLLAQLIVNRGYERVHEKVFDLSLRNLLPYSSIPEIEEGIERIAGAIRRKERIIIFGDYDVDGITATAILYSVLKEAGAKVVPVLPSRGTGYGLNERILKIFSRYGDLLITVDNGSSALHEFESFPIDLIVIDHHNVPERRVAKAVLINPRSGENVPSELKELSSSAMCFYIASVLSQRLGLDLDTRYFLDLVALGTVADVMPMNFLNRILVKKGALLLESVLKGRVNKPGVRALLEISRVGDKVTSKDISYSIAPRLNAPGRIGDPRLSLDLLIEEDPLRAKVLSRKVELMNNKRKAITEIVLKDAVAMARDQRDKSFIALWSRKWHVGVLGIVAGRISGIFGKPSAVFSVGEEKSVGSVRSPEGINIYEGLKEISEMFIKWGGHPQAMGITLRSSDLERFRHQALEIFSHIPKELPPLYADMELAPDSIGPPELEQLEKLEPYGEGNPFPTFVSPPLSIEDIRISNGSARIRAGGSEFLCWDREFLKGVEKGSKRRILYSVMNAKFTVVDISAT
jgi:single-stranded-DNA-specific exonuclease